MAYDTPSFLSIRFDAFVYTWILSPYFSFMYMSRTLCSCPHHCFSISSTYPRFTDICENIHTGTAKHNIYKTNILCANFHFISFRLFYHTKSMQYLLWPVASLTLLSSTQCTTGKLTKGPFVPSLNDQENPLFETKVQLSPKCHPLYLQRDNLEQEKPLFRAQRAIWPQDKLLILSLS